MTISQFIDLLQRRLAKHGDVEVEVTWEGIFRELDPEAVYLSKANDSHDLEAGILLIDADGNAYKDSFAADRSEGKDELW